MTAPGAPAALVDEEGSPVLVVGPRSVHVRRFVQGMLAAGQPIVWATDDAEAFASHPLLRDRVQVDFAVRRLGTPARLRELIRRWKPRVVHAHQANSVSWHAARACRNESVPLVVTIWGSDVLVTPHRGVLERRMVQSALRGAALWTADAAEALRAAREVAGLERPSVLIPFGVDQIPDDLDAVFASKQDLVLSCRLHKPLYRIDAIVAAFSSIAAAHPGWQLEVAAAGPATEQLKALALRGPAGAAIRFSGMLDAATLARSYANSRVFVSFPSSDGTSVSLLEAMAHGCVPVVSDLPANREWIVDGLNGMVVGSAGALADAIERAMELSATDRWRSQLAPANHRLVASKARFADNIRSFLDQYRRLGR